MPERHSGEGAFVAFAGLLVAVGLGIGLGIFLSQSPKHHPTTVATGHSSGGMPRLQLIGGSTCNESTKQSFSYKLSNFPPGYTARIYVTYPNGAKYTFIHNSGFVKISNDGTHTSPTVWACWYGPSNTMDPPTSPGQHYTIWAKNLMTGQTTKKLPFKVIG